jgi:hypothetical protein
MFTTLKPAVPRWMVSLMLGADGSSASQKLTCFERSFEYCRRVLKRTHHLARKQAP